MATYTENLKLIKPDGNDPASQIPFNENADILDKTIAQIASYAGNAWNYVKTITFDYNTGTSGSVSGAIVSDSEASSLSSYDELLFVLNNVIIETECIKTSDASATKTSSFKVNVLTLNDPSSERSFVDGKSSIEKIGDKNRFSVPDMPLIFSFMSTPSINDRLKFYVCSICDYDRSSNQLHFGPSNSIGIKVTAGTNTYLKIRIYGNVKIYGRKWALPT